MKTFGVLALVLIGNLFGYFTSKLLPGPSVNVRCNRFLFLALVSGVLLVCAHSGHNLVPMDKHGLSDPYCVIYENSRQVTNISIAVDCRLLAACFSRNNLLWLERGTAREIGTGEIGTRRGRGARDPCSFIPPYFANAPEEVNTRRTLREKGDRKQSSVAASFYAPVHTSCVFIQNGYF